MNFPPMGRRGRALALATAFLLLSICTAHADEASDLFDRIRTLCENGEFAAAREEASALVKLRRTNAGSKPYQVEDAERLLNLISPVSKKSGAARAEMAEGWRLDRAVDELLKQRDGARADSLASRRLGIRGLRPVPPGRPALRGNPRAPAGARPCRR